MGLLSLGAGVAIGYVIGSKRGRAQLDEQLENVKKTAEETWHRPDVQDFIHKASDAANRVSHDVADTAKRAAEMASDAVKKAAEKAEQAEAAVADVVDEAEETVERAAQRATWEEEGGAPER